MTRIFPEHRDLGDDLSRLFDWLGREHSGSAAECLPPVDVVETVGAVEIVVDLPGVPVEAIRVAFSSGVLVVAGQKSAGRCEHRDAAFHLAERAFGRFARAVRLSGALDASRATATLTGGELHIAFPRIDERRGHEIPIPVRVD